MRLGTRTSKPRWTVVITVSTILTLGIVFAPAAEASLSRDAMRHTRRMVAQNSIYDPRNLTEMLHDEPWNQVGASVVGCADTLRALHRAFMHHAAHRVILLNPQLRRIGIGVIKDDSANVCGRHSFWSTELFYG